MKQSQAVIQKENLKIKSDRERLTKICSELRKEINRLENSIKQMKKDSSEEDDEEFNNNQVLYYETPNIIYQNDAQTNSFIEKDKYNGEKIKLYSEQIEKLKSTSKEIENKFKFSK